MKKFKVSAFDAEVYQALSDPVVFADLFNGSVFQGDWIAPVFTVVFYYGEEQDWDGPVRIHEMLDFPEEIEPWIPCIPDYKINLVSSRTVDKENFQTGLREVFELLGVMGDREKLERLLKEEKTHYSSLDAERAGLVASFLDIPILKQTDKQRVKGRKVDMCTAIQEMVSVGKAEGKAEALLEFLEGMGTIPAELRSRILAERDTAVLGCWLRKAARIKNIEEFVLK